MIPHLHLVLPHALQQLRAGPQATPATLKQWLAHGRRTRLWTDEDLSCARLDPWQHSLLTVVPDALRAQGLASASLTRRGAGADWQKGSCLHVEPIHLAAGLDDLRLVFPPALSADESSQLFTSVQLLMSVAGFELHREPASDRWFMWCASQYQWLTYSPRSGFARRLHDIMPRGDHAPELRRLMTEVQMLLHAHPVNEQRARRGLPAINSLWFWGDAELELVSQPLPLHVVSNEAYVKGLCEHLHQACWPIPETLSSLLQADNMHDLEQWLLVLPAAPLPAYEQTLVELNDWLQRGRIDQLHVHLDHWRVDLQGGRWGQLQRRLRSPQTIDGLLA